MIGDIKEEQNAILIFLMKARKNGKKYLNKKCSTFTFQCMQDLPELLVSWVRSRTCLLSAMQMESLALMNNKKEIKPVSRST